MNSRLIILVLGGMGVIAILFLVRGGVGSIPGLDGDGIAQIAYMSFWGALVGSALMVRPEGIGQTLRQAVLWLGIFLMVMAGYSWRYELQDLANSISGGVVGPSPLSDQGLEDRRKLELVRDTSRHFHADGELNGNRVRFLVDTGASANVLRYEDAKRAGLDVDQLNFTVPVSTANGQTQAARARIEQFNLGPITRYNVPVLVSQKGALDENLLGMQFINQLWRVEIKGDRLILTD